MTEPSGGVGDRPVAAEPGQAAGPPAEAGAGRTGRALGQPAPAEGAPDTQSAAASLSRLLVAVGSPVVVATGLLFYFGWVRTQVQAARLGYDSALLDLSVRDYILRSVSVLWIALVVAVLLAFVLHLLHHRYIAPQVDRQARRAGTPVAVRLVSLSWTVWPVVGMLAALLFPPLRGVAVPAVLTLAALSALYSVALDRRIGASGGATAGRRTLLVLLLAIGVFWDTERVARAVGEANARQVATHPDSLVSVTVYSAKRLDMAVPGVVETPVGGGESLYRYRYQGLRLLVRSGDRYFLISDRWNQHDRRVLLLRETDGMRLEFSRSG